MESIQGVTIHPYPAGSVAVPPPGLYSGVPNRVYHEVWTGVVGNSSLQKLGRMSPFHAKREMSVRTPPTPAMTLGSLVNDFVLYGSEHVSAHYVAKPEFGRSKADLQAKAEFEAWAKERNVAVVSSDLMDEAVVLSNTVLHDADAMSMLSPPYEVTAIWEEDGLLCKARPDALRVKMDGTVEVADLKTAADASPHGFASSAGNFGYHYQFAFYRRGLESLGLSVSSVGWVVVEKDGPPHAIGTYTMPANAEGVLAATWKLDEWLAQWRRCVASGDFPGYPRRATLVLPPWSLVR